MTPIALHHAVCYNTNRIPSDLFSRALSADSDISDTRTGTAWSPGPGPPSDETIHGPHKSVRGTVNRWCFANYSIRE